MNDVLDKCNFLCQRLAQAEAKYQKAVSGKPAPCTRHRDGNRGRGNRGGRGRMNRGGRAPTQHSINHREAAARRTAEATRENTAPTAEATPRDSPTVLANAAGENAAGTGVSTTRTGDTDTGG